MSIDKIMNYFNVNNTMEILLAFLLFMIFFVLIKMTLNPRDTFDLKDLVSVDGKLDEKKFTRFGAWVISTWGFVYILVSDVRNLPEWYFAAYMGAWVFNVIADKYVNGGRRTDPPQSSINPPVRPPYIPNNRYEDPPKY